MGEGNLATAAASALAAAAVKAKVKLIITGPQLAVSFITFFFLRICPYCSFSFTFFVAPRCSGREEDQISCGSAGGDPNEEAGNQTATL